jgi:hypothetical protein
MIMKNYEIVRAEVLAAYSDCNKLSKDSRNLDFKASHMVSPHEACDIMCEALDCSLHEEGYNNFRPELLTFLPSNSEVFLAREGSVCIYVKTNKLNAKTQSALRADEIDVEGDFWRVWWD